MKFAISAVKTAERMQRLNDARALRPAASRSGRQSQDSHFAGSQRGFAAAPNVFVRRATQ